MRTEKEKLDFIKSLLPDFKKHKENIYMAYGRERVENILNDRVHLFCKVLEKINRQISGVNIEEIVDHYNEVTDKRCIAEGGDIIDNLYNKQLNIIAGMRIRGMNI
jgi:hypothetical protein